MTAVSSPPDPAVVRAAVEEVADPELPPVNLGMLGMVHDVRVAPDGRVTVAVLPTFSGCPATAMIERDVVAAVADLAGVRAVTVDFPLSPAWSPARISEEGHERLRSFGIAPPGPSAPAPVADGRRRLPLLTEPDAAAPPVPCPYCGSGGTARESPFGPTPCRDLRFCHDCQQPFEAFKPR